MGFLRLLLALAVVAAHAGPAFGWQWLRMTDGPRSVQAFYAVSGFYMTLVLHEKYVGQGTYGVFLRARLLRLYPLYAVVAAATVVAGLLLQIAGVGPAGSLARWQAAGAGLAPAARTRCASPRSTRRPVGSVGTPTHSPRRRRHGSSCSCRRPGPSASN
jgi:peptidoglycan/LPS O-acetylase OafA/YrhL